MISQVEQSIAIKNTEEVNDEGEGIVEKIKKVIDSKISSGQEILAVSGV